MWFLSLLLLICCIRFIDLHVLNNLCIPRMKPTWSWCMTFLMCYWCEFASILLRIFASVFIKDTGLWFFWGRRAELMFELTASRLLSRYSYNLNHSANPTIHFFCCMLVGFWNEYNTGFIASISFLFPGKVWGILLLVLP
jgi:hypothetical protein